MIYRVLSMRFEDIPQATEIDKEAFPTQWPPTPFQKELRNRLAHYIILYEEEQTEDDCPEEERRQGETILTEAPRSGFPGLLSRVKQFFTPHHAPISPPESKQFIVGYASIWLMLDESHLTSIAVKESHRRLGLGELLLISIIDLSVQLNAQVVTLEVRVSNQGAQALYEKYGFARVGVRRRYYSDNGEDAFIMTTDRITSAAYQAQFQRLKQDYRERWGANRFPPS